MEKICAFSSDSRDLYKADVYRVLALPNGHLVHFRYEKKYVDDNLLNNIGTLQGKEVVIFYTHGNKLEVQTLSLSNISIRQALITKAELSIDTGVFHVYMKLADFCNIEIDSGNSAEKKPGYKFFTELSCTVKADGNNWHDRISAIQNFFPFITFFRLKEIQNVQSSRVEQINYKKNQQSCYYDLKHGEEYTLKLAVSNPKQSDTKIQISNSNDDITINCINPFESSIRFDDQDISISVKALQVSSQNSFLQFTPIAKNTLNVYEAMGEYSTFIELSLRMRYERLFLFGFLSTVAVGSVLVASPMSSLAVWPSCWAIIIGGLLFFASSGSLFYFFNKK